MHEFVHELFAGNAAHAAAFADAFDGLQAGQAPRAVTICCSDSRVLQDAMWGNEEPGRIFTCGNIGNRAVQRPDEHQVVSGDVLYPLEHTATDLAVVVGHTGCGAVTATYDALVDCVSEPPGIEHCLSLLRPQLEPGVAALPDKLDRAAAVNHLVEYNVDQQVQAIVDSDDVRDSVTVVGAVYDFQDVYDGQRGEVHVINIDGERDPETLRRVHEEGADWIDRCWTY